MLTIRKIYNYYLSGIKTIAFLLMATLGCLVCTAAVSAAGAERPILLFK